jgi:hypothetical protein
MAFDCVRLRLIKKGMVGEYSTSGRLWSVSLRVACSTGLARESDIDDQMEAAHQRGVSYRLSVLPWVCPCWTLCRTLTENRGVDIDVDLAFGIFSERVPLHDGFEFNPFQQGERIDIAEDIANDREPVG